MVDKDIPKHVFVYILRRRCVYASDDVTLAINGQPVLKQSGSGNVTLTPTYVLIAFSILFFLHKHDIKLRKCTMFERNIIMLMTSWHAI